MIDSATLFPLLKYIVLVGCCASWLYAAFHGVRFEGRLSGATRDPRAIEALNHPATVFRRELPKLAKESRRKAFIGLGVFFGLGLCLLVILYLGAGSGSALNVFQFRSP